MLSARFAETVLPAIQPGPGAQAFRIGVPATAGELWQGFLHGRLLMVNCPITYLGKVSALGTTDHAEIRGLEGSPLMLRAAEAVREELAPGLGLDLTLEHPVPRGLGMASSTTELAASAYAAARALGAEPAKARLLAHRQVQALDSGNDANYFPGIHLVDPRKGERLLSFLRPPALRVLLVNTGGRLETLAMDRALEREVCEFFASELEDSLSRMIRGLSLNDLALVGAAATQNAFLYQQITPKPGLHEAWKIARASRALGLLSGHSGTVLGLLFPPGAATAEAGNELERLYGPGSVLGAFSLISGGFYEHARL